MKVRVWYDWAGSMHPLPMWFPFEHALEVGEQLRARGLFIRYEREAT